MVEFIKEEEVLNKIKENILSLYPILDDRLDALYENSEFEINISFLKDDNGKDITRISFMDGNAHSKHSVFKSLFFKGLMSNYILSGLITFLIDDHNLVGLDATLNDEFKGFSLSFDVNMYGYNISGISCNKIILNLSVCDRPHLYPNGEEVINNYFNFIINAFYEKLKDTDYMKKREELYYQDLKNEIIATFNEEDIKKFFGLLSKEDLLNIISNLPNDRFFEVLDDLEKEKNNPQLVKK